MSNNSSLVDTPQASLLFPFYTRLIVTIVNSIILIVGIMGNILVPSVVWTNKCMRSSTNLFLVNLSLADLLVLIICIPTVLIEVHTKPETWMLGEIMCKMIPYLEFTVAHVSALTILAISFERYYAICYPLEAGYTCTKGRAATVVAVSWVTSAILTSPVLLITEFWYADYVNDSVVPVCSMYVNTFWRKLYVMCSIALFFAIPLIILVVVYTIVCRNLTEEKLFCGRVRPRRCRTSSNTSESAPLRCRKQVVTMLIAVVVCFFICLFPLRAFHTWIILVPMDQILALGSQLYYGLLFGSRSMTYLNSAINPIIYSLISSKFRDAFYKHLGLKSAGHPRKRMFKTGQCRLRKTISSTNSTNFTQSTWIYDVPNIEYPNANARSTKHRVSI